MANPIHFRPSLFAMAVFLGAFAAASTSRAADFTADIHPLLSEYCLKCHSTQKHKGDLDLEVFSSIDVVKKHPAVWQKALDQINEGEMPPKEKPQPSPEQKARLVDWIRGTLDAIALERAGDPGRVVLRRLSNAEYTYTLRDLTGVESLNPAREFPVDGAAGEGFTNTGQALVMSPALVTKYLDAGKEVASHLVLLPDGARFSAKTTRRDWTNEVLDEIRSFYGQYTEAGSGEGVNLQGIKFNTNGGGLLPLEKYLDAALATRESGKTADAVAQERRINVKYLATLSQALNGGERSPLLDSLRTHWRVAKPGDAAALAADIHQWQKALWKFSSVGHIGKLNGPKAWMEPVTPLVSQQEFKLKLAATGDGKDITLYLNAGDAGDGSAGDLAVWRQPRLILPGRPPLPLRDVRGFIAGIHEQRERIFASTAAALDAAAEAAGIKGSVDLEALAKKYAIDADALQAWFDYLGVGSNDGIKLDLLTNKLDKSSNYDFIKGWGSPDTPALLTNSSDRHVRIPGDAKPHGVMVHPSPTRQIAVGWLSPIKDSVRIEGVVTHAHPECGNGVAWTLELRRGRTRQRLAAGVAQGAKGVSFGPIESVAVQQGDLISLLVDPRDGNHSCDLTDLEFKLTSKSGEPREWSLTRDVAGDVLAGNPHVDTFGHAHVWHFYTEPTSGEEKGSPIPAGSLLAQWQSTSSVEEKSRFAQSLQKLLTAEAPTAKETPDAKLYQQLHSLGGPLFAKVTNAQKPSAVAGGAWGVDDDLFRHRPSGEAIDPADLCVQAPSVVEVRLPADLFAGAEFVAVGALADQAGGEGSVQLHVSTTKPGAAAGLQAGAVTVGAGNGPWTSDNRTISNAAPIIVKEGGAAAKRFEKGFDDFRRLFPAALCYTQIVPVDEVVTLTLFHREDSHLCDLMLDDAQKAKLDRMWGELHFVSQDALTLVDAFEQIWQFATQDADPKVFEPMRKPIADRAAAFRQLLIDTRPKHVEAVLSLAEKAFRRPLAGGEKEELGSLYRKLMAQDVPHEEAVRLLLARVLVSPAFLYHVEKPGPGAAPAPVNDWELASRLSYFLWSSQPDAELAAAAASGTLHEPDVLAAQTRRLMADARTRRLATEFACSWLHIHDFDTLDEKSERHFPTFNGLREAMYEESIRFFADFFQNDRSVLSILDADHTFLNEALAKHYGIPDVSGPQWRRVDGVKRFGRGGVLAQATTLSKQSGASRTSPILRGNWVAEALLGDKLPKPPKDVPRLPEDEASQDLTVRQLTEKHTADPRCSSCHVRIDGFGYTLEAFDAIGRLREKDLGDRIINTRAKVFDGTEVTGLDGLRDYLVNKKRDAFLRQFCRKLLGYSLGRAVQLSDEPLLKEMQAKLAANDYHVGVAVETIIRSKQFREIRGREAAFDE